MINTKNIFLLSSTEYEIQVTTGNSIGAGTDAHVYMKIIGTEETTTEHELVEDSKDPFERGRCDMIFKKIIPKSFALVFSKHDFIILQPPVYTIPRSMALTRTSFISYFFLFKTNSS